MHYKFRYPELFDGVERPDFQKLSGNLVIYGAGFQGLLAALLLKNQGVKVLCFGDRDPEKQKKPYFGLPVYSLKEVYRRYPDAVVMVTPYGLSGVMREIEAVYKPEQIITPFSLFLEFDSEEFDALPELPTWYHPDTLDYNIDYFMLKCIWEQTDLEISDLDVSVTERCSLRCRECTSNMPCYESPKDFEYEDVLNDVLSIVKVKKMFGVSIEGGEPFLWKPLPKLLNALAECDEIYNIYPITNGTIIPDEELLKSLSNPKITVRISDYGKFSKIDELSKLFKKYNVKYKAQLQKWYKCSAFVKERKNDEELRKVLNSCCKMQAKGDLYTIGGMLFTCPSQANLHRLGVFKSKPGEYVDLRNPDKKEMQKQLETYMRKYRLCELCYHCNGRGYSNIEVPPAEQLEKGEKLEIRFE